MQQVQPAAMQAAMQSQQHWIILQQSASPEVQVTQQPSVVISHLHMPIVRLQQQTIMPFIMQQQETMPPAIILQRFCIMAQAAASVQLQLIFMPPAHFSIFILQRGTITMFGAMPVGIGIPMLVFVVFVLVEVIGFIIAVTIVLSRGWPVWRFGSSREMINRHRDDAIATQPVYVSQSADSACLGESR
jgi:hypothetical protein